MMSVPALDEKDLMNRLTVLSDGKWQVVAAMRRGIRHEVAGVNCEDACQMVQPKPDVLVIAVADGAGSVEFAEVGANVAVENGAAQVCAGLEQAGDGLEDATIERILMEAMLAALSTIQSEAATRGVDYRELASTLILTIVHHEFIAAAQIGDGATVIADETGAMLSLTTPPPFEYVNETVFLTSDDALSAMQLRIWRGRASGVAVFSDGLQRLCLRWPECEPHAGFFVPLFDFVRSATDEATAATELTSFLHSERVGKSTDDDVTLVVAALVIDHDEQANR
jgi:serine/threonine protein phosphatase PrpC